MKKPFDVYFNLHKKLFSIKDRNTGRVVAHETEVYMFDVEFKVSEAGRQRVIKEQRKNVHAYVRGYLDTTEPLKDPVELTYNPYKYNSFVVKATGEPIQKASRVLLKDRRIFAELSDDSN